MTPLFLGLPEVKTPAVLWLLLIIPVLLGFYIWALYRSRSTAMRFTNTGILGSVMNKQSQWKRHIAVAAALMCLATTIFAWARPMGIEKVPRNRATIVVAIDASLSMKAEDVSPNRLAAAKTKAKDFINSLPDGFNVAVVSIAEHSEIRMPPSTDRPTVLRAVDGIDLQDGTSLGGAIEKSLDAVKMAPGAKDSKDPIPAAIVMLSDGGNTQGSSPLVAANRAVAEKVPVYTIAFGTETGYVDVDGTRERVAPDTKALSDIAERTGAQSWTADSADKLQEVYKQVHSSVGYEPVKKEVTAIWAFYAFCFAVVSGLTTMSVAVRWP
ncbi:VWA domain-containing protein [Cutibacterium equinum]|uniref:VWA domain-containing protein n=1 Tax=Cutibacterium equinum TaxID=3016342 RepID=A0ABY7R226_9ACTN|nr:VWA domain-containing protein [Cutibacterium equinum]WCC80718.1 VWA domain-containing protein [Cutibacterium equinum]